MPRRLMALAVLTAVLAPAIAVAQLGSSRPAARTGFTVDGVTVGRLELKELGGTAHIPEPGSTPVSPRGPFVPPLPTTTPDDILDGLLTPITRAPAPDAGPVPSRRDTPDAGPPTGDAA